MMFQKKIVPAFLILFFLVACVTSLQMAPIIYAEEKTESITYSDGSKYVGKLKDGKPNGQGTFTWPDGRKHVGEWKDGKPNGQSTLTWPSGLKLVGVYKDGKRNGQCTYTFSDGSKYVAEYKDGKSNGQGTFTWPDGRKYVGEYKDDKRNGQATMTWPDGTKYIGEFKDGICVSGEYTLLNGSKHKGKLLFNAYITYVFEDSQAERIGLRSGDIVVEYNEIPINMGSKHLWDLMSATNSKDKIKLKVLRGKEEKKFVINGGRIKVQLYSYPVIPESVTKAINVAKKLWSK